MAKRIWLLDDDVAMLRLLSTALTRAGYDVRPAQNLHEFETLMHEFTAPPDLVLLDVQMPELFGDEIVLMLRTVRKLRAKIWLMSAMEEVELAARAEAVGADGILPKAMGLVALVEKIRQQLAP